MTRLRNTKTGVVVNVDGATAERLGSDWMADPAANESEKPRRTTRKKADPAPADDEN